MIDFQKRYEENASKRSKNEKDISFRTLYYFTLKRMFS